MEVRNFKDVSEFHEPASRTKKRASGIAETSQLGVWVWERTDVLEAGNTAAAAGKGTARSAALLGLASFGAFCSRVWRLMAAHDMVKECLSQNDKIRKEFGA